MFPYFSNSTYLRCRAASQAPDAHTSGVPAYGLAGLPWDGAVTNRSGARHGPAAIRQASQLLCDGHHPVFEVSPLAHLEDHGDLMLPNTSLAAMRQALLPQARTLIERQHMVWLGGDHSVTLPLLPVNSLVAIANSRAQPSSWLELVRSL